LKKIENNIFSKFSTLFGKSNLENGNFSFFFFKKYVCKKYCSQFSNDIFQKSFGAWGESF